MPDQRKRGKKAGPGKGRQHDDWHDSTHPPADPATDLGGGIWASWAAPWSDPDDPRPIIWHWCDRSVYRAARDAGDASEQDRLPEWYERQWVPTGVGAHTLHAREPLHLEPSLVWPDCCGRHGWIRGGRWQDC